MSAPTAPEAIVNVQGLTVSFGGRRVLEQIDLAVGREIVALMGASGVGKSTLVNCIAGLLPSYQGAIAVLGKPPKAAVLGHDIGYVSQKPALLPWLTAKQNVRLPLQVGTTKQVADATFDADAVESAMRKMAIWEARDKYPHELSGGMQARVALARAIIRDPSVLLLDEAFAGLDDMTKDALHVELQHVLADGGAAIVVTHSLVEAITLADRIVVIDALTKGDPARVLAVFDSDFARPRDASVVSAAGFNELHAKIRSALRRAGVAP